MKLQDILAKMDAMSAKLDGKSELESELASLRGSVQTALSEQEFTKRVDEAIKERISGGSLVTKEVAEKDAEEAVAKVKEEHEAEKKAAEVKETRLAALAEAKIDLDYELPGGKTIKEKVEAIGTDSEDDFTEALETYKLFAVNEGSEENEEEAVTETASKPKLNPVGSEAASKKKKKKKDDDTPKVGKGRFARFGS